MINEPIISAAPHEFTAPCPDCGYRILLPFFDPDRAKCSLCGETGWVYAQVVRAASKEEIDIMSPNITIATLISNLSENNDSCNYASISAASE